MEVCLVDVSRTYKLGGAVRLARILRGMNADVLHTHTALAANVLSRGAGRLGGAAVVSHVHIENHFRQNRVARALHTALDNCSARLAARVLAVSEDTRSSPRMGLPARLRRGRPQRDRRRGRAARHGAGLRAELGVPVDSLLIGEIARLCDVKGQRELIEAVALVHGRPRRARRSRPRAGRRLPNDGRAARVGSRCRRPRPLPRLPPGRSGRAARSARRVRAAVVDRGAARRRARGDGARQGGDRDAGRRHCRARRHGESGLLVPPATPSAWPRRSAPSLPSPSFGNGSAAPGGSASSASSRSRR